jgi:hypothetical protein
MQEQENQEYDEDKRNTASAVVSDAGAHAVSAKAKDQNKDDEKDEHAKTPFNEF